MPGRARALLNNGDRVTAIDLSRRRTYA